MYVVTGFINPQPERNASLQISLTRDESHAIQHSHMALSRMYHVTLQVVTPHSRSAFYLMHLSISILRTVSWL